LRRRRQMLQGAAPAQTEVRAGRDHAVRGGAENVDETRFVELPAALVDPESNSFSGQRPVDEHGFAVDSRDPPPIVGQIDDVGFLNLVQAIPRERVSSGQAAANSLRCAAVESLSSLRTRATSRACSTAFRCPRTSSKRK
jgi:hypothetical protein